MRARLGHIVKLSDTAFFQAPPFGGFLVTFLIESTSTAMKFDNVSARQRSCAQLFTLGNIFPGQSTEI